MTAVLDFTAVDFETANRHRGSVCSIGLVRVRGGEIVLERHRYVQPPIEMEAFEARNIEIHGITPEMVEGQPRFGEIQPAFLRFIGDDLLVAHNAAFDMGVIRKASVAEGFEEPVLRSVCTCEIAKRDLPELVNHKLPTVCEHFGISIGNHHDALADARAAANVFIALGSPEPGPVRNRNAYTRTAGAAA